MHKRYELTGMTFGSLIVLQFAGIGDDYSSRWLVHCKKCGTEKIVIGKNLVAGRTRTCGCMQGGASGLFGAVKRTHGESTSPMYTTWVGMKQRCYNPRNPDYHNYGGRGIKVCDEWRDDYMAFRRDMKATWQRGLTLDRIDNDRGYEPNNCRWVPMSEQGKHRRSSGPRPKKR